MALGGIRSQPVALFALISIIASFTLAGFVFLKDNGGLGVRFCCMRETSGLSFAPEVLCSVRPRLVKKLFKVSATFLWSLTTLPLSFNTMRP